MSTLRNKSELPTHADPATKPAAKLATKLATRTARKRQRTRSRSKLESATEAQDGSTDFTGTLRPLSAEELFNFEKPSADFWRDYLSPMLEPGQEPALFRWMFHVGLLKRQSVCCNPKCLSTSIRWLGTVRSKDKACWECLDCKQSIPLRTGSFFVNLKCDFKQAFSGIRAWCDQVPLRDLCQTLDLKVTVGRRIYKNIDETLESYVQGSSDFPAAQEWILGGEGSVVLLDLWPNGEVPAPRNDRETKRRWADRLRVLWLADTNCVPVRYWACVLPPLNSTLKEQERTEEMASVAAELVQEHITPHSLVLANEQALPKVCDILRSTGNYEAVMSVDDLLTADCNGYQPTKDILKNIWHSASGVCEELQTATRGAAARKITEFLWRQKFEVPPSETMHNLLPHIASHYCPQNISANTSANTSIIESEN